MSAIDPTTITLDEAQRIIADSLAEGSETNRLFFDGDHWQDAAGWIGPAPQATDDGFTATMAEIKGVFTSYDGIGEVVKRHTRGVLGNSPIMRVRPREPGGDGDDEPSDEQAEIGKQLERVLRKWAKEKKGKREFREASHTLLLAQASVLRLYVPPGLLEDTEVTIVTEGDDEGEAEEELHTVGALPPPDIPEGADEFDTLAAWMDLLWPGTPEQLQATVFEDPETKREIGLFVFQDVGVDNEDHEILEVTWVDPETGETQVRVVDQKANLDLILPAANDLGGRLTMYAMEREQFISEQARQQQRAMNLAETMVPRNVITGGFVERVLRDAVMPGDAVFDSDGRIIDFKAEPVEWGAGSVQWLKGRLITDDEGKSHYSKPEIDYRDPVDPGPSTAAAEHHYRRLLGLADQLHVLIQGEAAPSGVSRQQARRDHQRSLRDTADCLELGLAWMFETAMAMAEAFMGDAGKWTDDYEVVIETRLDAGPASPEQEDSRIKLVEAGLLSKRTAVSLGEIEDVDSEMGDIELDGRTAELLKVAEGIATLALVDGMDVVKAARFLLGIDEDDPLIEALVEAQAEAAEAAANAPAPATPGQEAAAEAEAAGAATDVTDILGEG